MVTDRRAKDVDNGIPFPFGGCDYCIAEALVSAKPRVGNTLNEEGGGVGRSDVAVEGVSHNGGFPLSVKLEVDSFVVKIGNEGRQVINVQRIAVEARQKLSPLKDVVHLIIHHGYGIINSRPVNTRKHARS